MSTPTAQPMRVTIMAIGASGIPSGIIRARKCYVELILGGDVQKCTKFAARGDDPSWDDVIRFDTDRSLNLELHVYAHHHIRHDGYIGGIKEAFDSQELTQNVSRNLYNYDARGNRKDLQAVIQFTVSIYPGDVVVRSPSMGNHTSKWEQLLANVAWFTTIVDNIVEVHPYAKIAWNILSAVHRMIIAEFDRDKKINHLVEIMNEAFVFVKEAEPLRRIASHRWILVQMMEETIQCAHFIHGYSKHSNFWARAIEHFMADVDVVIKQHEDRFKDLQAAFQNHLILAGAIYHWQNLSKPEVLEKLASEPDFKDLLYGKNPMRISQGDHHSKDDSKI
jgi:hypothetical protein